MTPIKYKELSFHKLYKIALGNNWNPPDYIAQYNLGLRYDTGRGVLQDLKAAARWYLLAAEHGFVEAQYSLGLMYADGRLVINNQENAIYWLQLAADQGHESAMRRLGSYGVKEVYLNKNGKVTDRDNKTRYARSLTPTPPKVQHDPSLREFQKAINSPGNLNNFGIAQDMRENICQPIFAEHPKEATSKSLSNMSISYENGGDACVRGDYTHALKIFRSLAAQGSAHAQHALGLMYSKGEGVLEDDKEAFRWARLAAAQGYDKAQFVLGWWYYSGKGVYKDEKEAVRWFLLAAAQENAHAQGLLGVCYLNLGDEEESVRWTRLAAEQGDARCQGMLGLAYHHGLGVPKDNKEALRWCHLAAEQGDQFVKHTIETIKQSIVADDSWDFSSYRLAAEQGKVDAQSRLGLLYEFGWGVARDEKEAARWYRLAADQGQPFSQSRLGLLYEEGRGVSKDDKEAVRWYLLAVEQGDAVARYTLGVRYANGHGVIKDDNEAIRLCRLAADQGNTDAQAYLDQMYPNGQPALDPITAFLQDSFAGFVGLQSVRDELFRQASYVQVQKLRVQNGLPTLGSPSNHLVFIGNPGTGKTTIARIIASLYYRLGILKTDKVIEIDRAGMVAAYIGQTALKTQEVVQSALGGVLFIDEAYTLARGGENDFGQEAIDTLLKMMEDHRNDLVVIVAGYESEMDLFIKSNPGLASRFNRYVRFSDYTPDELLTIFTQMCQQHCYVLSDSIHHGLRVIFEREIKSQGNRFSNARYVRNLFERVVEVQAHRLISLGRMKNDDLKSILMVDIENVFGEVLQTVNTSSDSYDLVMQRINNLIGLDGVKEQVRRLADFVRMQRARSTAGIKVVEGFSQHLVFSGNPGTGKTTVARLIADLYFALGVLPSNHIIEVDRSGLVAGYIGQSALKTREVIDQALGGVLFIDEAYALSSGGTNAQDFGREVIDTLLKSMEDHRGKFVVIVAGYSDEMTDFIDSNPGLRSRFGRYITFDDYLPESLFAIFSTLCHGGEYELDEEAKSFLFSSISGMFHEGQTSGNGRFVRNLFERCVEVQSQRISRLQVMTSIDLKTFTLVDVTFAIREIIAVQSHRPKIHG